MGDLLRQVIKGREPSCAEGWKVPFSMCRRSPGRLSLAGCVPAEPASVSPDDRIVLVPLVTVNLLGRDSLLAATRLAGLSRRGEFGVSGGQDGLAAPGEFVGRRNVMDRAV